jgi:predicted translation initiation factor SUI1
VKKDKKREPAEQLPSALKHNPFAGLLGARPSEPEAQAQAPAKAQAPAPAPAPAKVPPPAKAPAPTGKTRGRLVLRRETKHRGGKAVIIITGFAALRDFDEAATEALAKKLKQQLGCGGTVEEGEIILQGDRAAKVAELLRAEGFRVDGVTS